jgi:hypothetical protein
VVPPDERDQLFNFSGIGVIHTDGNAAPAGRGNKFRRFFNGFRSAPCGAVFPRAAAGAIDSRARFTERNCNSPPCTACRAGDQRNLSFQFPLGCPGHETSTAFMPSISEKKAIQ